MMPAYEPTEKDRKIVQAMASYGVPQEDIGRVIGVSHVTLRKYYQAELDNAAVQANAKVAETCFKMATSGKVPASTFFWLKTRAKWRETQNIGLVDKDGNDRPLDFATVRAFMQSVPDATPE